MDEEVDAFYEYAKNNFLNLIKSNKGGSKNEIENKASDTLGNSIIKKSRIKGWNENDLVYIEQLKKKEIYDNEKYDDKYKKFLLKGKREKRKKYEHSHTDIHKKHKNKHSETEKKNKEEREKKKRKEKKRKRKKKETSNSSDSSVSSSTNSFTNSSTNNSDSGSSSEEKERRSKYLEKLKKKSKKHKGSERKENKKEYERDGKRDGPKPKHGRYDSVSDSDKERRSYSNNHVNSERLSTREKKHRTVTQKYVCNKKTHSNTSESEDKSEDENDVENKKKCVKAVKNRRESDLNPDNDKLKRKLEQLIEEKKNEMLNRNALNKNLADCKYCIDSNSFNNINKLNIVSISKRSYICYYNYKNIFLKHQLFISPIEHTTSITNTNPETINDIRNHMKSLICMLEENNQTCIFVEFNNCFNRAIELISMRKTKHTYINCYVIPLELLSKAKSYFKKNLEEVNSLYRENKQLIITNQKYAPYNVVPKNMPYVSVNFALVETYIQIIENNYDYINMCKCIFSDIYKKDKLYKYFKSFDHYVNTVEQFKSDYKKFDWTNYQNN